jgi:riboflavin kinase/FMN adenylyltransferase
VAHQKLIGQVVSRARELGLPAAVVLFEPLPKEVLVPGFAGRLSTLPRKLQALEALGADHACIIRFDRAFAGEGPRAFVEQVLHQRLGVREIFVGFNFSFGQGARGTPGQLERFGYDFGFHTNVLPPVSFDSQLVSSSAIRELLRTGAVEAAAAMLGRPYSLEGEVVRGDGRANRLGFPTANLQVAPAGCAIPGHGVYAGCAATGDLEHPCVVYIGVSPTFKGTRRKVEVHLLGFSGELIGQPLRVQFSSRIREERTFASEEDLVAQLERDIRHGQELHRLCPCELTEARP